MKLPGYILVLLTLISASSFAGPVEIIPSELQGAVQPQVAVAPGGRIHVVFGKENTIYHTASEDGRSFSAPVKVGELAKLALRMRRGPRISATDKLVVVTAISHTDGNIHAWTSADGGATWKEGPKLNDADKSAREGLHAMAGDGNGFVFATWLDLRNPGTELWSATSQDGGVTWSANKLVYQSPDGHICECCHPSVTVDARGRVAVMWRNWLGGARDLYLTTSADRGRTFTAPQKVGSGTWKLNGCPMDGGALAFNPEGKPFAVWRREKTVFASATPTEESRLAEASLQPVVAFGRGGAYVLWERDGNLTLQRGMSAPARFATNASAASMASTPDGRVVVVWESAAAGSKTLFAEIVD
jgi:hypothetical protein